MKVNRLQTVFALLVVLTLTSCRMAKFDRVPGEELISIPDSLRGTYTFTGSQDVKTKFLDSFTVDIRAAEIRFTSKALNLVKYYNQDFKIAKYHGLIMIAFPDQICGSLFNILVLEPYKGDIRVYVLDDKRYSADAAGTFQNYLPMREILVQHEAIVPIASQTPISDQNGTPVPPVSAPSKISYYMVNDDNQFEQLVRNEFLGKDYILLRKEKSGKKSDKK